MKVRTPRSPRSAYRQGSGLLTAPRTATISGAGGKFRRDAELGPILATDDHTLIERKLTQSLAQIGVFADPFGSILPTRRASRLHRYAPGLRTNQNPEQNCRCQGQQCDP